MINRARDVLSNCILRVDAATPISELVGMRRTRVSHVAVLDQGKCLGLSSVNEADSASSCATFGNLVQGLPFVEISEFISFDELGGVFEDSDVDACAVHDEAGGFVGVVTRQSLLDALLKDRGQADSRPGQNESVEHDRVESMLAGEKRILEIISTSNCQDKALNEVTKFVETHSDGACCAILLVNEDQTHLEKFAGGSLPEDILSVMNSLEIGPDAAPCGTAAYSRQTVVVDDIANDLRCKPIRDIALKHGLQGCWSHPIISSSGKVLGTISIFFERPHSPDADHRALVDRAVNLSAIAIERKRTEESLRASETTSRTLLEGSPVCTKIIDLDFALRYMSTAGQNQLKIGEIEPFYGTTFPPELYPESWRAPVTKHLERAMAGEISSLECPVLDTDGNEVWYDTTFVPARDEEGKMQYVIVTSVNITERRRAEESLRASRRPAERCWKAPLSAPKSSTWISSSGT